jgi:hypothetical protein
VPIQADPWYHQVKLQPCQVSMPHHLLWREHIVQCSLWAYCTPVGQNWWPNKWRENFIST